MSHAYTSVSLTFDYNDEISAFMSLLSYNFFFFLRETYFFKPSTKSFTHFINCRYVIWILLRDIHVYAPLKHCPGFVVSFVSMFTHENRKHFRHPSMHCHKHNKQKQTNKNKPKNRQTAKNNVNNAAELSLPRNMSFKRFHHGSCSVHIRSVVRLELSVDMNGRKAGNVFELL